MKLLEVMGTNAEFALEKAPNGSVLRRKPDLSLIDLTLGNRERVSLATGLESTLNWYRDNRWVQRE